GRGMTATLQAMSDRFGFPVDVARDAQTIVDDFRARVSELELKPGALALLDRARAKIPVALASSSSKRLIDTVLARFALAPRFAPILSGESVARPKPAPDVFLRAALDLGVDPTACAVLEDSIAGATAGRAAGMFVLAVPDTTNDRRPFEAVADVVVPTL